MRQVNADMDEALVLQLDRLCAAQSISRPELMRRLAREAVAADAEGRDLFAQSVEQISGKDVALMVYELRQRNTELDRLLRAADKREAEMRKLAAAYDSDTAAARERGTRLLHEDLDNHLQPLLGNSLKLRSELAAQFDKRFEAIERHAKKPRIQKYFNVGIGHGLASWQLTAAGLFFVLASIGAFYGVAKILPQRAIAIPLANDLLGGGDQAVCALIRYRFGTDDCVNTNRGVKATVPTKPVFKTRPSTR